MTNTETRVQERATGRKGNLLNAETAPIAIVQFDDWPYPSWAEWSELA
ncbi:hypothetical protein [Mycobacterium aquaticum]|nr:hypothetical protein [Mycobacterium aquaticum]